MKINRVYPLRATTLLPLFLLLSCVQKVSVNSGNKASVPAAVQSEIPQKGTDRDVRALEQEIHALVNKHRTSRNMSLLQKTDGASAIARTHAEQMAQGKSDFSHAGFDDRLSALEKNLSRKTSEAAENLGTGGPGKPDAQELMAAWLKSSGHRKNIEGNFTHTGIGVAKNSQGTWYITQIFYR